MLRLVPEEEPRVLILIPCLNEAPRISQLVTELLLLHPTADVLVVDDGSSDDTGRRATEAGASVLRLPFNLGYGAALQTGYKYALARDYDLLVQMDGDGQHPASEVSDLLLALEEGETDLVVGSRFLGRADYRIPRLRLIGIRLFSWLTSVLAKRAVTDPTSGFQAMNRRVMRFYGQDFYPYDYPDADMLVRVHYGGLSFREVPVVMLGGPPGKSMHSGLRPAYYVYKLLLSLAIAWFSGPDHRAPTEG
ncbi:MAG TPA: glycosyl transferase family 2 [Deltaproteobacteria bacterium]|nr:glycosyl transferase family 2 [Deltaproteobacteria bacterium]HCP46086.1 glycosyl transferase family 2 [Deltaproteobacteria bacterium]